MTCYSLEVVGFVKVSPDPINKSRFVWGAQHAYKYKRHRDIELYMKQQ